MFSFKVNNFHFHDFYLLFFFIYFRMYLILNFGIENAIFYWLLLLLLSMIATSDRYHCWLASFCWRWLCTLAHTTQWWRQWRSWTPWGKHQKTERRVDTLRRQIDRYTHIQIDTRSSHTLSLSHTHTHTHTYLETHTHTHTHTQP